MGAKNAQVGQQPKIEFDYYYGAESEQFSFIRIPRVLFSDKEHFGTLSNDAKLLYGFFIERMNLSRKNNWIDESNRVYIIFPLDEIAEVMGVGHDKANHILKELDDVSGIGLVKKKRRGLGLPSIIYVKNFILDTGKTDETVKQINVESVESCCSADTYSGQEIGNTDLQKSENQISGFLNNGVQEVRISDTNYKDINKKEMSYIEIQSINQSVPSVQKDFSENVESVEKPKRIDRRLIEDEVREQIDYNVLLTHKDSAIVDMATEIKDLMVDVLCGERDVIIDGKRISRESTKSAFRKIKYDHVRSVIKNLLCYPNQINRIDRFILASLYNSAYTETTSVFSGFEYAHGWSFL